jgi:hypothetical protein
MRHEPKQLPVKPAADMTYDTVFQHGFKLFCGAAAAQWLHHAGCEKIRKSGPTLESLKRHGW